MQVGMTLPVMEPDLERATLEAWARAIDEGPFSSLCFGERMAFDNPETLTLLGAVSAWTERVRLVTTVVVPQLHDPVHAGQGPRDRRPAQRRTAHRRGRASVAARRTTAPSAPGSATQTMREMAAGSR